MYFAESIRKSQKVSEESIRRDNEVSVSLRKYQKGEGRGRAAAGGGQRQEINAAWSVFVIPKARLPTSMPAIDSKIAGFLPKASARRPHSTDVNNRPTTRALPRYPAT